MLHANIPQNYPKRVLCDHFFVTMPHVDTRIRNLMPNSCVESFGDSFDTHHDLVVQMGPKWRLFFAFDPGFERDARVNLKIQIAYSRHHLMAFRMRYQTWLYVK